MLLQNIESKIRLAFVVSVGSFLTALVMVAGVLYFAHRLVIDSREYIYVLDAGVPVLLRRTDVDFNRRVEYEGHIQLFHTLFYTLVPDDEYIERNMEQAMYLIDKSGITEYNNLKEKGYYNAIISTSSVVSIQTDSIKLDMETLRFTYYGTQRIERTTSITKRRLVSEGSIQDLNPRSDNNPFAALILNWRTILNEDISHVKKRSF